MVWPNRFAPAILLFSLAMASAARAQQPAAFVQPRIPEDVRRFESYSRAGVWRYPPKEVAELESRLREALGLPEATPGTGSSSAGAGSWEPTQFKTALQRESQRFAAKMLPIGVQRTNLQKEVKDYYLSEERSCSGEKPEKCLEEAKRKACVRLEDGYQRLHDDWRMILLDFYQTKLEVLTESDQKLGTRDVRPETRALAREWMQKSYQEMTARFVTAWGASLERQWGDYCTVPPPADAVSSGWESTLRSPFSAPK